MVFCVATKGKVSFVRSHCLRVPLYLQQAELNSPASLRCISCISAKPSVTHGLNIMFSFKWYSIGFYACGFLFSYSYQSSTQKSTGTGHCKRSHESLHASLNLCANKQITTRSGGSHNIVLHIYKHHGQEMLPDTFKVSEVFIYKNRYISS